MTVKDYENRKIKIQKLKLFIPSIYCTHTNTNTNTNTIQYRDAIF